MKIIKTIKSFGYAFKGIGIAVKEENNFQIELTAAAVVLLAGWFFDITTTEWIFVIFAIGTVLMAEAFNSAIENLCDAIADKGEREYLLAGKVKDLSAGATLIIAIAAAVGGGIIFLPHIAPYFLYVIFA